MENEEREQLEAELRILHSRLDASSSECGDWNLSKVVESLIDACVASTDESLKAWGENAKTNLSERISERMRIRERINEIEALLEEM